MRPAQLALLAIAGAAMAACGEAPTGRMTVQALVDVDLGAASTAFSAFSAQTCADLMPLPLADVDDAAGGEGAPVQVVEGRQHVFGKLAPGPWAFFVLANDIGLAAEATTTIGGLDGHELARGCVDAEVQSDQLGGVQVAVASTP